MINCLNRSLTTRVLLLLNLNLSEIFCLIANYSRVDELRMKLRTKRTVVTIEWKQSAALETYAILAKFLRIQSELTAGIYRVFSAEYKLRFSGGRGKWR